MKSNSLNRTAPVKAISKVPVNSTNTAEMLSERETEILQHMADGLSSKHIGEALSISEDTVETHRKNIYRKIAAKNAAQAMAYGFRNNLIK
ncbi:MAG TPA: LuxR C-terminal-related transcriptional regulator [Chitinophagales bacterium]|nr:LuxR C-terminal-related transcriptional regulator [Chitinophagales bacterium]